MKGLCEPRPTTHTGASFWDETSLPQATPPLQQAMAAAACIRALHPRVDSDKTSGLTGDVEGITLASLRVPLLRVAPNAKRALNKLNK